MEPLQFIVIFGIVAALSAVAYTKRIKSKSLITKARERAAQRARGEYESIPFEGGVQVQHFTDFGALDPSQENILKMMEQGIMPIKKTEYKYQGAPRESIAGIPTKDRNNWQD